MNAWCQLKDRQITCVFDLKPGDEPPEGGLTQLVFSLIHVLRNSQAAPKDENKGGDNNILSPSQTIPLTTHFDLNHPSTQTVGVVVDRYVAVHPNKKRKLNKRKAARSIINPRVKRWTAKGAKFGDG